MEPPGAAADVAMFDPDAPSASLLGTDDLRCVFAALLSTHEPAKDLGRCLCVAKEWRDTLHATPSIWFKLLREVDPAEADAAAAAAPAPAAGAAAAANADPFRDHDFYRRFVEQYCWRKTRLCSGCFAKTGNAGIQTWKVRLCSPCMAASILNKTDAGKTFILGAKQLNALPTWTGDVHGPFGDLVKFYFRRHLERAAAEKHGAAGVEGARAKQLAKRDKRAEKKKALQLADKARLEALLQAHGVTHGSHEWREMQPLSKDVDAFLANGAKGKGKQKRRRDPWGGLPQEAAEAAPITCIDDALIAVEKALTHLSRRKMLMEVCRVVNLQDAHTAPALKPHFDAFVNAEGEAVAAKQRSEPASKRRKSAAASKRKQRGYASSDESEEEEEPESSDSDDESGSEDAAGGSAAGRGAPGRRSRSAAAAGIGAASLRDAAVAAARELVLRKCCATHAQTQLDCMLAVAMLEHDWLTAMLTSQVVQATEPYQTMLAALAAPLPADAAAAPDGSSLGSAAAAAIVAGVTDRMRRIDAALEDELNELSIAWSMSRPRMLQLLGATGGAVPFDKMVVHGKNIRNELVLHGKVMVRAATPGAQPAPLQLDGGVSLMMHHLRLMLRKSEMKERYDALLAALSTRLAADAAAVEGAPAAEAAAPADQLRTALEMLQTPLRAGEYDALRSAGYNLHRHLHDTSNITDGFGDMKLVPAVGDEIAVAHARSTQLGQLLQQLATQLFKTEAVRQLFVRWVLDGMAESEPPGAPQPAAVADVASHVVAAEDSRAALLAAIFGAQVGRTPPVSAPRLLVDRLMVFFSAGTFQAVRSDAPLSGDEARQALLAWAAEQLAAQTARRAALAAAFEAAGLEPPGEPQYSHYWGRELSNMYEAVNISLEHGLGFLLLGPHESHYYAGMARWTADAVDALVRKARDKKKAAEEAKAASADEPERRARLAVLQAHALACQQLRGARDAEVMRLMSAATVGKWASQPIAAKHAKANSALYKQYVTNAQPPAAPTDAAPPADDSAGGAGPSDAAGGGGGASGSAPLDAAAVAAELLPLFKAANGLSKSVFRACQAQERNGQYGF